MREPRATTKPASGAPPDDLYRAPRAAACRPGHATRDKDVGRCRAAICPGYSNQTNPLSHLPNQARPPLHRRCHEGRSPTGLRQAHLLSCAAPASPHGGAACTRIHQRRPLESVRPRDIALGASREPLPLSCRTSPHLVPSMPSRLLRRLGCASKAEHRRLSIEG